MSIKLAIVACALSAGCLVEVKVDASEVKLSYRGVAVPATKSAVATSFVVDDLAEVHELIGYDPEVRLLRAELHPIAGITSFDFVDSAHVTLAADGLPELAAYDCAHHCVAASGDLTVPAAIQRDVVDYLRRDAITVDVALAGRPPATSWSMDVDIFFAGSAHARIDAQSR